MEDYIITNNSLRFTDRTFLFYYTIKTKKEKLLNQGEVNKWDLPIDELDNRVNLMKNKEEAFIYMLNKENYLRVYLVIFGFSLILNK